jgi:hypothetical protein
MAKYRVLRSTLLQGKDANGVPIQPRVLAIGDEITDPPGWPSSNLEPLDKAAETKMKEAEEHFAQERREGELKKTPAGLEMFAAIMEGLEARLDERSGRDRKAAASAATAAYKAGDKG